mmetsp:Transcript_5527/g.24551  ORF Transcript_5527/g.24551 Transcript_5527/m.24551 type:complete len:253 (+) Transcript_5527:3100-3858(+)
MGVDQDERQGTRRGQGWRGDVPAVDPLCHGNLEDARARSPHVPDQTTVQQRLAVALARAPGEELPKVDAGGARGWRVGGAHVEVLVRSRDGAVHTRLAVQAAGARRGVQGWAAGQRGVPADRRGVTPVADGGGDHVDAEGHGQEYAERQREQRRDGLPDVAAGDRGGCAASSQRPRQNQGCASRGEDRAGRRATGVGSAPRQRGRRGVGTEAQRRRENSAGETRVADGGGRAPQLADATRERRRGRRSGRGQ